MLHKALAIRVCVLSLGFLLVQTTHSAPIFNGGFESGDFSGWSLGMYNDTAPGHIGLENLGSVVDASINAVPAGGGFQALLSTGYAATSSGLDSDGAKLTSLLPLVLLDGWRLAFDWNFLTDELPYIAAPDIDYDDENRFNDRAGVVLKNLMTGDIVDLALAAAKEFDGNLLDAALPGSLGRPVRETGYSSYFGSFAPGIYELSFYVTDVRDTSIRSYLLLDNIRVVPVPEPESLVMLVAGLFGIFLSRKRRSAGHA